jgi:hypothetical protein
LQDLHKCLRGRFHVATVVGRTDFSVFPLISFSFSQLSSLLVPYFFSFCLRILSIHCSSHHHQSHHHHNHRLRGRYNSFVTVGAVCRCPGFVQFGNCWWAHNSGAMPQEHKVELLSLSHSWSEVMFHERCICPGYMGLRGLCLIYCKGIYLCGKWQTYSLLSLVGLLQQVLEVN